MKFYYYIAANSNWHVISVAIHPRERAKLDEMEAWAHETYGDENEGNPWLDGSSGTWFESAGDFMFKNESDAMMFKLTWSHYAS